MQVFRRDLTRASGQRFILTVPDDGASILVVVIGGSGPASASGPLVKPGVGLYDLWADELVDAGWAVARSDKATSHSREIASAITGLADEYCEDISQCTETARQQLAPTTTIGLAHSLGAIAALRCSTAREFSGLVVVAPPLLPILPTMLHQLSAVGLTDDSTFEELAALGTTAEVPPGRTAGVCNEYWADLRDTSFESELSTRPPTLPVLVLTAGRDGLVPDRAAADAVRQRMQERHLGEPITWHHLETADHGMLVDGSAAALRHVIEEWMPTAVTQP